MRLPEHQRLIRKGFSLAENLLSLLIIALIVPTAIAALSLSLDFKRNYQLESKSVEIAQYVFNQIPYAWREEGSFLFPSSTALTFPQLNESEPLHMLFTESSLPFDKDGDMQYGDTDWKLSSKLQAAPSTLGAGYIVSLSLDDFSNPHYDLTRVRRFSVKVAHPSGAPAENRKTLTYSRLIRK